MRIKFMATADVSIYRGKITFFDGQEAEVDSLTATYLISNFPKNFIIVVDMAQSPAPADMMVKGSRRKSK